jgi:hypothetical protein
VSARLGSCSVTHFLASISPRLLRTNFRISLPNLFSSDILAAALSAFCWLAGAKILSRFSLSTDSSRDSDGGRQDPADLESGKTRLNPMSDIEQQYRRMEAFLYKHRKEWEIAGGSQYFEMDRKIIPGRYKDQNIPFGPWMYKWQERSIPEYNRPNPFDLTHQGIDVPGDTSEMDEFDIAIDFGAARDRIRKNFEWEMDRIFLAEEMCVRSLAKVEQKKVELKKRRRRKRGKNIISSQPAQHVLSSG